MASRVLFVLLGVIAANALLDASSPSKRWPDGIPVDGDRGKGESRRVINGFPTDYLSWTGSVFLENAGCTGVYVHPRVVMTANHCCGRTFDAYGGADRGSLTPSLGRSVLQEVAPGNSDVFNDMCLVLMDRDKPAVIPHYDIATVNGQLGDDLIVVGYGDSSCVPRCTGYGTHRLGLLQFNGLSANTNDILAGARVGADPAQLPCDGDSGAPLFIENQLGWVVHAVNSRGSTNNCSGGSDLNCNTVDNLAWIRDLTASWGSPVLPGICPTCKYDESWDRERWFQ